MADGFKTTNQAMREKELLACTLLSTQCSIDYYSLGFLLCPSISHHSTLENGQPTVTLAPQSSRFLGLFGCLKHSQTIHSCGI